MQVSVQILLFLVCIGSVLSTPVPGSGDSARIVNGYEIDIRKIPYQASIRRRVISAWAHMCGAVIISNRGILTAAHCADSYVTAPSLIRVAVGTSSRVTGGKTYDVSVVYIHENYSPATLEHDIAILKTARTITFDETTAPISVASEYLVLPVGTGALVSGFGTISYEGSSSPVLLAADVSIVSQAACARAYLRIANITSGMVCANASDPPRDACQGDSGGPLVVGNHLVGIVSWGEGCASTVHPGVYTKVSAYSTWIWQQLEILHNN